MITCCKNFNNEVNMALRKLKHKRKKKKLDNSHLTAKKFFNEILMTELKKQKKYKIKILFSNKYS